MKASELRGRHFPSLHSSDASPYRISLFAAADFLKPQGKSMHGVYLPSREHEYAQIKEQGSSAIILVNEWNFTPYLKLF